MKTWMILVILSLVLIYMIYRYTQYKKCMKSITSADGTVDKTKKCSFSLMKDTSVAIPIV